MNWFKLLKAKESMAFGTEEGIQFGMEDLRYFEECCEEARTLFLRLVNSSVILTMPEKLMYEHQTAELNCEDFRAYLEEEYRYAKRKFNKKIFYFFEKNNTFYNFEIGKGNISFFSCKDFFNSTSKLMNKDIYSWFK